MLLSSLHELMTVDWHGIGRIKIRDITVWFAFLLSQSLSVCSSRDIHAMIAYCLVCLFVLVLFEAGQMEQLVGGSLCPHCLGSKYTAVDSRFQHSMHSMFQKVFFLTCVCPKRDKLWPELPLRAKLSLLSPATLDFSSPAPLFIFGRLNWQFIIQQLLKSLTLPQKRDYALQINFNSHHLFWPAVWPSGNFFVLVCQDSLFLHRAEVLVCLVVFRRSLFYSLLPEALHNCLCP